MIKIRNLEKLTSSSSSSRSNTISNYFKYDYTTQSTTPANPNSAKLNKTHKYIIYCNSQITKNGRNGNLNRAESIFNRLPSRTVISWTAMLTAYAHNGEIVKARKLFDEMPQRNTATWNAMISGYIRCNLRVSEAFELFSEMPERNYVSYAAMIMGFARAGRMVQAQRVYNEMPFARQNTDASNALMYGYLKKGRMEEALRVFESMVERDVVSWSSMLDGYCKNGRKSEVKEFFRRMPERNVVSWTTMIRGYMKADEWEEGFRLFIEMRREKNVEINSTTLTVIFEACSNFGKLREGIQVHGLVLSLGFGFDLFLGNAVITLYNRVGLVDAANDIFSMMNDKDVVSWNSMISGYVQNNLIEEAYKLFMRMPSRDVVSWTSMSVGLSSEGRMGECVSLFAEMPEKDCVAWTAVISGFVGNGEYEEAFHWFINMLREAVKPDDVTLSSILVASAGLATLDKGEQIHAHVVKMELESDVSVQNSLVSMYAKCGNVDCAHLMFTSIRTPNIVSLNSMITGFAQHGLGEEALQLFGKMQSEGHKPNEITFLGVLSACGHVGLVNEGWEYFKTMRCVYGIEPGPYHYACMVNLLGRSGLLKEALDLIRSMPCKPHEGVWGALLIASRTYMDINLAKLAATHLLKLEPDNATIYTILSDMYSIVGLKKSPGSSWL